MDGVAQQIFERIRNALTSLTHYRSQNLEDARIEDVMNQLEFVQGRVQEGKQLTRSEKDSLNFNLIEGTPFEDDEVLVTELYSIKNFAMNSM